MFLVVSGPDRMDVPVVIPGEIHHVSDTEAALPENLHRSARRQMQRKADGNLLGTNVGPWKSPPGGPRLEVPELPTAGQLLETPEQLLAAEIYLHEISRHFDSVEFGIVRLPGRNGATRYLLVSGRPGDQGFIPDYHYPKDATYVHTHPPGPSSNVASTTDRAGLLPGGEAYIALPDGTWIKYNGAFSNTFVRLCYPCK